MSYEEARSGSWAILLFSSRSFFGVSFRGPTIEFVNMLDSEIYEVAMKTSRMSGLLVSIFPDRGMDGHLDSVERWNRK